MAFNPILMQQQRAIAQQLADTGDFSAAERAYSHILQSPAPEGSAFTTDIADIRGERGHCLVHLNQVEDAIAEYEQATKVYEDLVTRYTSRPGLPNPLRFATSAAMLQVYLSHAYLLSQRDHTTAEHHLVERMLPINKLIKKRYEIKVSHFLHIAQLFLKLGDNNEASEYLGQAQRFYRQQLEGGYDTEYLGEQIQRLQRDIPTQALRTVACTVAASTPDELEAVLNQLSQYVPDLTVTRGVKAIYAKSPRGATIFNARIKLVINERNNR